MSNRLLWNDYEMLVLQLFGTTRWQLYRPTAPFPTKYAPPTEPTAKPECELSLARGSGLYVPRGYWYEGIADEQAELHVRIMFRNATASDMLYRLVDQLSAVPLVRMDYPLFGDADNQSKFLTSVQAEVIGACASAGFIRGFLKDMRAICDPRPACDLPWSTLPDPANLPQTMLVTPRVRFLSADAIRRLPNEDAFEVFYEGRMLRLESPVGNLFRYICYSTPISLAELLNRQLHSRNELLEHLTMLLREGLIVLRESEG
jgi:hypothetical protein